MGCLHVWLANYLDIQGPSCVRLRTDHHQPEAFPPAARAALLALPLTVIARVVMEQTLLCCMLVLILCCAGEVLSEVRREFSLQRGKEAPYDIKFALSDGRNKLKMLEEAIGFSR